MIDSGDAKCDSAVQWDAKCDSAVQYVSLMTFLILAATSTTLKF